MKLWPLFGRKANEDGSVRHSLDLFRLLGSWGENASGVDVTLERAMQVSAVLGCARVIAEGLAQVPFKLHQQEPDGRVKRVAREHPLFNIVSRRPNPWMTSFQFRETMGLHTVLTGDGIAFVNRAGDGRVLEMFPLTPGDVTYKRNNDYTYTYTITAPSGAVQEFPSEAIWHWRGPSWDSVGGLNVVKLARTAIGLAAATEDSQARAHRNGLGLRGVYSMEGPLGDKAYKELRAFLDQEYGGAENAGKTMILDRGAKFYSTTQTGVDAQHLETRRYQVEEVCRAMRVIPIMIGYSDKAATYASVEQMFLAHSVYTMAAWYTRIEQSGDMQLLSAQDIAKGYYLKFNAAGLLRGALKDTAEYLVKLTSGRIITPNEAREKLEMNPVDGGDEMVSMPGAATPEDLEDDEQKPPAKPNEDNDED